MEDLQLDLSRERDYGVTQNRFGARGVFISGKLSDAQRDEAVDLLSQELRPIYEADLIRDDAVLAAACPERSVFLDISDPSLDYSTPRRSYGYYCSGGEFAPETVAMVTHFEALAYGLLEANGGQAPLPE